jgi:ribosome-associated protein
VNSGALFVSPELRIPRDELTFRASRAGGPGGQHVNKSSTRIELVWSVRASRALTDEQRSLLTTKLATRLDVDGEVRIVASDHRSQTRNRDAAEDRLARLIRTALAVPKARRKTRPTRSGVEKRLQSKHIHSKIKRARKIRDDE